MTDMLESPGSLTTYKNTLLIANENFISMLDMTKFPPLSSDFLAYLIYFEGPNNWLMSNSICSLGFEAG